MSAVLVTSTVTPGRAPPDASRTCPAMAPVWAAAIFGSRNSTAVTTGSTDLSS